MRDENDGFVRGFPDALQIAVKLLAGHGVERGERLIHEQQFRIRRKRPRKGDALLHAAGKLVNVGMYEMLQSDHFQVHFRDVAPLGFRKAGLQIQAVYHVGNDVQPRKERGFLKHHQPILAGARDGAAVFENFAGIRLFQPGDDI